MLRPVTGDAELRQVDQLLQLAYQSPSRLRELALYRAAPPAGLFAIFEAGEAVAAAGIFGYGSFSWLGLVGAHPDYARQGLATRLSEYLLDWSREHGCGTVALDASDKGRPVYERLGFQPAGEAIELVAAAGPGAVSAAASITGTGDLTGVLDFDRPLFGGDRAALLRAVGADDSRVYRRYDGDRLAGYLFARGSVLGPGAALDPEAATGLIKAALADVPGRVSLIVPAGSAHHETLLGLGLRENRRLTHMRYGVAPVPGRRELLLAQTSFAAG
jgi:GNAT superfamily N-acetyltransferase